MLPLTGEVVNRILNLIWPNLALISATETSTINYRTTSVAKMIPVFLWLPVTYIAEADIFSKFLCLVKNTDSLLSKRHKFSQNKFTGGGREEADADKEMLTGKKTGR